MQQSELRSAINLDTVSADGHRAPWLQSAQGSSFNRIGILTIQSALPKARDRLVTIGADAALTEAAELLFEPTCRMVVVCDATGIMVGVITRTDIIRQIRHCQGCACTTSCITIMRRHVISCRPDDALHDVWTVMKERQLHSIPVTDPRRRPIGLLSARDALEALLASVEYEESLLRDYVTGIGYR
jgi:CBS domain-containing protein